MGRGCGGEPVVAAASSGWQKQGWGAGQRRCESYGDARLSGSSHKKHDVLAAGELCALLGSWMEHLCRCRKTLATPPAKSVN